MDPAVYLEGRPGANAQGVARPEVDQREAELSVFQQKLVAAAAGVCPGLGTMEYDGPLLDLRSLHPQGD